MAETGGANLEFRVNVGGLNQLGQLQAQVMKLKNGIVVLEDASHSLGSQIPRLTGSAKELQKIFHGEAQSVKMLVRNQKIYRREIKGQLGTLKLQRQQTQRGTQAYRAYSRELVKLRKDMRKVPLRKFGTDLKRVSQNATSAAKNMQWLGRQMMVGITAPIGIALRFMMQSFESFERQFVRTKKILDISGGAAADLKKKMLSLSSAIGASTSIVAGLTSDFAQMGKALLGGGQKDKLSDLAVEYAGLALELEKVGEVSVEVGRDFIANLAGMVKQMDPAGDRIAKVAGLLAKFNMMENTTALSLKDLAEAFPQVSPAAAAAGVDLVFLSGVMANMKEVGLDATESAHALKFSLQRMINPTAKVRDMAEEMGSKWSEFNVDLGMGNMLLFNLAENLNIIDKAAGKKAAVIYLGELVGKRQASRMFAAMRGMEGFTQSVKTMQQQLRSGGAVGLADLIGGVENLEELEAKISSAFSSPEAIQSFRDDIIAFDQGLGSSSQGFDKNTTSAGILSTALQGLSPPLKSLVIDFMGATQAGETFADEFNLVMAGPAAVMQRLRNDIKIAMQEMGTAFFDAIEKTIIPAIKNFTKWVANLSPTTKKAIMAFTGLLAVIGPVGFSMGQLGNIVGSLGRVMSAFLPKMKSITVSMLLAKQAAGEPLPRLRRLGTGLVQVGRKAVQASSDFAHMGNKWARSVALLKQDPHIAASPYQQAIVQTRTVAVQGSKSVAAASTSMSASAAKGSASVAASAQSATVKAEGSMTRMFRKTERQFDTLMARIKAGAAKSRVSMRHIASARVGQIAPQPTIMKRVGGRFTGAKFPNPAEMAVAWSRKLTGVADHFASKFSLAAYSAAGKMDNLRFSMSAVFKMIRVQAIISAGVFGMAFKGAIKAIKFAMMTSGILAIFLIIGSAVAYVVSNLDMFKEAGKNSFGTFSKALSVLKEAFLSIGKIFFEIFGEIFGKTAKDGSKEAASGMDAVGRTIQGVANIFLGFAKVVRNVMQTFLPPIIRFFLTVVKKVADGVGAALGWMRKNWEKISKTVSSVVYWIVKIMEFWIDMLLMEAKVIASVLQWVGKAFFGLLEHAIVPVFRGIWKVVDGVLAFVIGAMRKLVEAILWAVETSRPLINKILSALDTLGGALDKIGMGWSIDFRIPESLDDVKEKADTLFDVIQAGRAGLNGLIQDKLGIAVGAIGDGVDFALEKLIDGIDAVAGADAAGAVRGVLEGILGGEFGLGNNLADDIDDKLPDLLDRVFADVDTGPIGEGIAEEVSEAMQDAFNTFVGKVKSRLIKELRNLMDLSMKKFDAYTKVYLSAYDTRINVIQKVVEAEKELTRTIKYESDRRSLINKMALDSENFVRNRALALYEGRVEDARNLSVQFGLTKTKSQESLSGLAGGRASYLLDQKRRAAIDTIKDEQKVEKDRLKDVRDRLKGSFDSMLEDLPATDAELQAKLSEITSGLADHMGEAFGPEGGAAVSLQKFATIIDSELTSRFNELFRSIGIVSDGAQVTFTNAFTGVTVAVDEETTKVATTISKAVSDWLLAFLEFDPVTPFQRIFDLVNEEWKGALEWDLIAQGWMAGFMDKAIPHIIEQLKVAQGLIEDAMTDTVQSVMVNPELFLADKLRQDTVLPPSSEFRVDPYEGLYQDDPYIMAPGANFGGTGGFGGPGVVGSGGGTGVRYGYDPNDPRFSGVDSDEYSDYYGSRFNGGAIKAQYGRYLNGFRSAMVPIMAHGGEYVMNAKAVQNVGLSNLEAMNSERNYDGGGDSGGVNIYVENFIGQPEWFEGMMQDYNISVAPRHERSKGLDSRRISSMADNNRRGRV